MEVSEGPLYASVVQTYLVDKTPRKQLDEFCSDFEGLIGTISI